MTQEALKQMYQLLLTEPHAPTVCAQLERIAREALAEHAMRETQRLGQEIEQEPVAILNHAHGVHTFRNVKLKGLPDGEYLVYTHPPQRKPMTDEEIDSFREANSEGRGAGWRFNFKGFARAIEAAHGIKENT